MATVDARALKPKLTIDEQIEHLKSKGVTFERCSESEAAAYLADVNYYFRVTAYRTLFEKRVGGAHDGEYVGLDFADLIDLAALDQELRNVMLPMTIAIEHAAKTQIMAEVTNNANENGYGIIADYLESLPEDTKSRRLKELSRMRTSEYSGEIMKKYGDDVPIWLYLEFSSFGAFVSLYRFCALRWDEKQMEYDHYLLRQCVALRNASAHGLPIMNGFKQRQNHIRIGDTVAQAVADAGISKRVRTAKLKNPRLQQIVTTSYLYTKISDGIAGSTDIESSLLDWKTDARKVIDLNPTNDAICSSLGFLLKVFDKWS